jgi:hypothetical protein
MLRFGFLFLAFASASAMAQLRYVANEPVILHDGAGSAEFTLANIGTASVPLTLHTGPFSDDTSQMTLAAPKVSFTLVTGAALPPEVDPGQALHIEASVSNLSGSGSASAPLFNGTADLGRLQALEADAPFDISITGDGSPDRRLVLMDGGTATLTLKNGDTDAYPVDWSFEVEGRTLQSGELQLAPHGSANVDLLPTSDLYSWTDGIHPSARTGHLMLSIHGPPTVAKEILPSRTLPVSLTMMKLSSSGTRLLSYAFVTLVLLLGGLLSVVGNTVLPNTMRKTSLRRQIDDLAGRTDSVSLRVGSYLRTLLRMERKRLDVLLKRSSATSFSFAQRQEQVSVAIDRLNKRVKVAQRLDELRNKLEDVSLTAPPSVTDGIDNKLQLAAAQLQSFALTDDDVSAANKHLDAAETSLAMLSDTDALSRLIAGNFRDLKVRQKFLPYSYYNDLKAALPGLFEMLNQPFDDFRNIPHQMMFAVDFGVAALQMAFDYSVLRASAPSAAVSASSVTGQNAKDRLIAHQKELIGLLGTLSWAALRDLRSLVQQMRENIYERDVLEEISARGQAEIALDPQTVRPYLPVLFTIRFKDSRFNDAAAIQRLTCKWDFPNEILEQDWKICHFFQGNELTRGEGRDISVSVRVECVKSAETAPQADGKEAAKPLRSTLSAMVELHKAERPSYSQAFAEAVRFLIAFGVALAALLSGALQQLEKLDFLPATIAILAVGFGADAIKNLLMQTSKKAAI